MQTPLVRLVQRTSRHAAAALVSLCLVTGCAGTAETEAPRADPPAGPTPTEPSTSDEAGPLLRDAASPVGGTVKQLVISSGQMVEITCDQAGFQAFVYDDQGFWAGCEIAPNAEPGALSELGAAVLADDRFLTIPGPASAVLIDCRTGGEPRLRTTNGRAELTCAP